MISTQDSCINPPQGSSDRNATLGHQTFNEPQQNPSICKTPYSGSTGEGVGAVSRVPDAVGSEEGPDAPGRIRPRHPRVGGSKKSLPFTYSVIS